MPEDMEITSKVNIVNSSDMLEESKPNIEPWSKNSIESTSLDWEPLQEQDTTLEPNMLEN